MSKQVRQQNCAPSIARQPQARVHRQVASVGTVVTQQRQRRRDERELMLATYVNDKRSNTERSAAAVVVVVVFIESAQCAPICCGQPVVVSPASTFSRVHRRFVSLAIARCWCVVDSVLVVARRQLIESEATRLPSPLKQTQCVCVCMQPISSGGIRRSNRSSSSSGRISS